MDIPAPLKLKSQVRLMKFAWDMGPPAYRYRPLPNLILDAYSLGELGLGTWEARYGLFTLTEKGIAWCQEHFGS
jgi:hypothetical protein